MLILKIKNGKIFYLLIKINIKNIIKELHDVSEEMGIPVSEIKVIADRIQRGERENVIGLSRK